MRLSRPMEDMNGRLGQAHVSIPWRGFSKLYTCLLSAIRERFLRAPQVGQLECHVFVLAPVVYFMIQKNHKILCLIDSTFLLTFTINPHLFPPVEDYSQAVK